MTVHPATLLLAWGGFIFALQPLSPAALVYVAMAALPLVWLLARRRILQLMRRARWLLLSIALLFALATPGQRLPGALGDLGVTQDGLLLAAEHVVRLVLLLASLAIVHERLGTSGMMAGLYWLLAPLSKWRAMRERIVVRLMLVLDHVESAPVGNWREWLSTDLPGPDRISLTIRPIHWGDRAILSLLLAIALLWSWLA